MKRNHTLDYLRGTGIILMILMHCLAWYFFQKGTFEIWDYIHIVVPIFVFVSSWIYFEKGYEVHLRAAISYFKKRVLRLLLPYYLFLIPLTYFSYHFDHKPISRLNIIENITLSGGVDINWLVLLFIMMMFLTPLYFYLSKHKPIFFYIVALVSILSTIIFCFVSPPFDYRLIMWLPWSSIVFFAYFFLQNKANNIFLWGMGGAAFSVFIIFRYIFPFFHHSLVLQSNKYPPNLYYLSYGIGWLVVLYSIYNSRFMVIHPLNRVLSFFSRHSYSIFFIHYLAIYYVARTYDYMNFRWYWFFIVILFISFTVQVVINTMTKLIIISQKTIRGFEKN